MSKSRSARLIFIGMVLCVCMVATGLYPVHECVDACKPGYKDSIFNGARVCLRFKEESNDSLMINNVSLDSYPYCKYRPYDSWLYSFGVLVLYIFSFLSLEMGEMRVVEPNPNAV